MRELPPERLCGQGLDPQQFESGDRTILALLNQSPTRDHVDLVATYRDGAYEIWSTRGMVRFKRHLNARGELAFEVVEQIRENPVGNQDRFAVATLDEELTAAERSGNRVDDPNLAFIEPGALSHPHAYERIAQTFDSPRGPDLIVSPKCYAYGVQPGQHGAIDVVQSRAPLFFAGPGVRPGQYRIDARHVDIAPTIARLMGFPLIDGLDFAGRPSAAVYLKRQDGRAIAEIVDGAKRPSRAYLMVLDGLSHSELMFQLARDPTAIPNLAWLAARSAFLTHGSIVNFPGITCPSHSTILTGAWSGHHDVVNPAFYLRETRETIPLQAAIFDTEGWLAPGVETLYEAFKRVLGREAITASVYEPQGRGADHAPLERRIAGDKARLKALTAEMAHEVSPRWAADAMPHVAQVETLDIRALAQVLHLFEHFADAPPVFVAHQIEMPDGAGHDYGPHHSGLREALHRTDRRIGTVLEMLRRRGLIDSTLFVVTSDHGMAPQRTELKANPSVAPSRLGIKGVYAEPMIYLRDVAIKCTRTPDGRNLRVAVSDNDAGPDGERAPVEGARVTLFEGGRALGASHTSGAGAAAFATPAHLKDRESSFILSIRNSTRAACARTPRRSFPISAKFSTAEGIGPALAMAQRQTADVAIVGAGV